MYNGLLHLHSAARWVILLLLVIAVLRHLSGMMNKKAISRGDRSVDLMLMIVAHITFVVGLYQWIVGPLGLKLIQSNGMGEVMKNSQFRFWAVEHITGMFIAIILITVARGAVKRSVLWTTHKKAFWLFFLALIIIVLMIPWPFREGIGRPWFPGM